MNRLLPLLLLFACRGTSNDSEPGTPAECGTGVAAGSDTRLMRWPYLQRVTSTSAVIAFGAQADLTSGTVSIGRDTDYTTATVSTSAEELPFEDTDNAPRTFQLHAAEMTGLSPATEYCYRIEAGGVEIVSGLKFRTAPDDPEATVRFLVLGDYGAGNTAEMDVREAMMQYRETADFLVTTGDNAYSNGTYGQWQANVFEPYQHMLTRVPFFPTLGNHDYYVEDAEPALRNLFLPENADVVEDVERYWSTDWGPIHLVGLDSEDPLDRITEDVEDDDERDWFEDDLAQNDRPWTIVSYHRPMRTNTVGRNGDEQVLDYLVPTIEEYEVPLVVQGHDHNYARFVAMQGGQPLDAEVGGTTYVITGGGGAGLYDIEVGKDELQLIGVKTLNFMYGTLEGCTLKMEAIDATGAVFDTFTIDRC
jgi:acid phosphatase type 7